MSTLPQSFYEDKVSQYGDFLKLLRWSIGGIAVTLILLLALTS